MKAYIGKIIIVSAFLFFGLTAMGQNNQGAGQNNQDFDIDEAAEKIADNLADLLDLDDAQLFRVDSILKHDYKAMNEEMAKMQASKVANNSVYLVVQDKWMEKIDEAYRKIFTDEQWQKYLKIGGADKAQKARAKRKEKAENAGK